jgi:hypothetical protein
MTEAHVPHPRIAHRKAAGVHVTSDEHIGFNGWLAACITKGFGSMWAFYVLVIWMFAWMFLASVGFWIFQYDKYPFTFLLNHKLSGRIHELIEVNNGLTTEIHQLVSAPRT